MKIKLRHVLEFSFLFAFNILIPASYQLWNHQPLVWYFYVQALVNIISFELTINKKMIGVVVFILSLMFSIIIDYTNNIYGDALLRLLYMLPLHLKMLYDHYKPSRQNNDKANINFHIWTKKEALITAALMITLIFVISFNLNIINKIPILNLLFKKNDPYIYLDALSVVANVSAAFHFSRLHRDWYIINVLADCPLAIIWLSVFLFQHNPGAIVFACTYLSFTFISIYGWINELKHFKNLENNNELNNI